MYVGYALIGMYCFGDQEDLFGNIFRSCRSLFALINGDSILLYYQSMCTNTTSEYCALAQIYLYTYLVIFITTVLNVFIFIIETGYGKATRGILHDEVLRSPLLLLSLISARRSRSLTVFPRFPSIL